MGSGQRRWTIRPPVATAVVLVLFLVFLYYSRSTERLPFLPSTHPAEPSPPQNRPSELDDASTKPDVAAPRPDGLICPKGGDDVVVVIKTGATEAYKLRTLLKTFYRCIPHVLIFSDLDEFKYGQHLHDALDDIPETVLSEYEELQFYVQMRENHRLGKAINELDASWDGVKEDSMPWRLDKWKFLPMVRKAFRMHAASWYVFVEADTYLSWPNLLKWLPMLDSKRLLYLGAPNWYDDSIYAHGGSGFILSETAITKVVELLEAKPEHFIELVAKTDFGDLIMADALREVEINLSPSWPMIQGETPQSLDYTRRHWCHPMITEHHMSSEAVESLWEFEQSFERKFDRAMLHADIYKGLVEPKLVPHISDWDNMSHNRVIKPSLPNLDGLELDALELDALESEGSCRILCVEDQTCVRYSWMENECKLGNVVRMGVPKPGISAGFLLDRINKTIQELGTCETPKWILHDS